MSHPKVPKTEAQLVYLVWYAMLGRCYNPKDSRYSDWGGRGIEVCDQWRQSFDTFSKDMGPRPTRKHSIDRIDNHGPYSPENCRWATGLQQGANRRNNQLLTLNGKTQHLHAWSRELGIPRCRLTMRLRRGWTVERALTAPLNTSTQFQHGHGGKSRWNKDL